MGSIAYLFRSPEPQSGPAAAGTIGGLIEAGHGLTATCEVCLHSARLNLKDLAARLGADHSCSETDLRPHLQCSVCKSVDSSLEEIRGERHGTPRLSAADLKFLQHLQRTPLGTSNRRAALES